MIEPVLDEVVDSDDFRRLQRLLSMTVEDSTIVDALMLTPDFACLVLAEANSAGYSGGTEIATLDRAVVLLGVNAIAELAASVSVRSFVDDAEEQSWSVLVAHSASVAIGAGMIARAVQLPLAEEVRTLGVIHDLGMHILYTADPQGYSTAITASVATASRIIDHERFHCGTDHGELAEILFRKMELPESICVAVGFHHDPLNAPNEHRYLSTLLFAGECLARRGGQVDFCGPDFEILEPRVLEALRLGQPVVEAYVPLFQAELTRLGIRESSCPLSPWRIA